MKANQSETHVTVFFCQRIDPQHDSNGRSLEKELGTGIRFFPMPCSGRVDVLHLLKALENGAEKVYVVTCPEKTCRYGQGSARAGKRLEYAKRLVREAGLSEDCLEMVQAWGPLPMHVDELVRELLNGTAHVSAQQHAGSSRAA